MTVYKQTMTEAYASMYEAKMSSSQIAKLKKAYEPMRGKKISTANADKLSKMLATFAKDKDTLIQLFKADIPFVSQGAVTQLITKHNMKGAQINKLKEMGIVSEDDPCWDNYKQVGMKMKDGKEVPNCVPEEVEKSLNEDNMDLMKKAAGGAMQHIKLKDGKLKMDSFTASAIMGVYDKVNPANKKKIETIINRGNKTSILKLQSMAMKQIKSGYHEEVDLDEAQDQIKQLEKMLKDLEKKKKKTPGDGFAKMRIKELIADLKSKKEEVELDEAKNYEIKNGKIHISKANFRKVHKDYKNSTKGKERMMALDPKSGATTSYEVVFEEVDLLEFTRKDFDKNEDNNMHTENAVELARKFGSKSEYNKMVAIYKSHMKRGHISSSEQTERDKLVKKYLPKLKEGVELDEAKVDKKLALKVLSMMKNQKFVRISGDMVPEIYLSNGDRDELKKQFGRLPRDFPKPNWGVPVVTMINHALGVDNEIDTEGGETSSPKLYDYRIGKVIGKPKTVGDAAKMAGLRLESVELGEEVDLDEKVHWQAHTKDGKGIFQILDRDTKGMAGKQDKFKMQIVDKRGKVIKDLGSHVSVDSARKFARNRKIVDPKNLGMMDPKHPQSNLYKDDVDLDEGTWKMPKSKKQIAPLLKLMRKPVKLGKDGDDAAKVVAPYIGDDELEDDLYAAGKKNPNGDARPAIRDALQRFGLPWQEAVDQVVEQLARIKGNTPADHGRRGAVEDDIAREKEKKNPDKKLIKKLEEGKMKELHGYIQQGKTADWIAKKMKLDVKTIKALIGSGADSRFISGSYSEGAAADARRAMRADPDMLQRGFSKDIKATDDDVKGASKNIIMQMRKAQSLSGNFPVEFADGKKVKIPKNMAVAVQQKYNALRRPVEKEKFQTRISKSYKDLLKVMKEELQPKHESILDRIDKKIKENKNG